MPERLRIFKENSRLVGRTALLAIFDALFDLAHHLPGELDRNRLMTMAILVTLMRDSLDRRSRGLADSGSSISGVAATLSLPFETVRRHIHRLESAGLLRRDVGMAVDWRAPALAGWHSELAQRMRKLGVDLDASGILPDDPLGHFPCDSEASRTALNLTVAMVETVKSYEAGFGKSLMLQYICTESTRALAQDMQLAAAVKDGNRVPSDALRAYVSLADVAAQLGVSRATTYRFVAEAEEAALLERKGRKVRPTAAFLAGPAFSDASQEVAGRIAILLTRLARHQCTATCNQPLAASIVSASFPDAGYSPVAPAA